MDTNHTCCYKVFCTYAIYQVSHVDLLTVLLLQDFVDDPTDPSMSIENNHHISGTSLTNLESAFAATQSDPPQVTHMVDWVENGWLNGEQLMQLREVGWYLPGVSCAPCTHALLAESSFCIQQLLDSSTSHLIPTSSTSDIVCQKLQP